MKTLKDLIHERNEKLAAIDAIMEPVKDKDGNATEERTCQEGKEKEWRALYDEVEKLNSTIEQRQKEEEASKQIAAVSMRDDNRSAAVHTRTHEFDVHKAIRNANHLDGLEKEISDRNAESIGIKSDGLILSYRQVNEMFGVQKRAAASVGASDYANITQTTVDDTLSIIDYQTILQKLGVTELNGLQGQFQLNYKDPQTAEAPAEGVDLTYPGQSSSKSTLAPAFYGWADVFTKQALANANPALHRALIMDAVKAIDKKVESAAMVVLGALTAKTGHVGGTDADAALDRADLTEFEGALKDPSNLKYVTNRVIYSGMRDVKVDTGSGRFLVDGSPAEGLTSTGVPIHSTGFMTNTKDIILGNFAELYVGDWGMFEILYNPYTYGKSGQLEVVISQIKDVKLRNPAAFVRASNVVM